VKDYTKGRHVFRVLVAAAVLVLAFVPRMAGEAATVTRESPPDLGQSPRTAAGFAGWHLPVPAGVWLISRGPCGSGGLFTHQCGYYEDSCAIDLTPLTDSMLSVPVLAPQAGQVFFLGTRSDSGMVVMLQHDDGRVSALMHLSKVVVGLDQRVAQGQVVAYAGNSGSSTRPHLHFDVQPNAVERACLPLTGLDEIDLVRMTVRSHNLAWSALLLPDPPEHLPDWLPLSSGVSVTTSVPRLVMAPSSVSRLPVAVPAARPRVRGLFFEGKAISPTLEATGQTLFSIPLRAPASPGDYLAEVRVLSALGRPTGTFTFTYSVRPPADSSASLGLIWINPTFASPANWSNVAKAPKLCWSEFKAAGAAPLSFRVMVAGPVAADSGWQANMCWTPPALPRGTYFWKVFVRDARGFMNRTNQRPFAFTIR
jgi:hypothetical protein